jgi:hypothetical protein
MTVSALMECRSRPTSGAGFVTVTRLIWFGIVADLLVMLVVGIAIGWLLNKIVERRNSRIEQN